VVLSGIAEDDARLKPPGRKHTHSHS
jgi:hypothetical protein